MAKSWMVSWAGWGPWGSPGSARLSRRSGRFKAGPKNLRLQGAAGGPTRSFGPHPARLPPRRPFPVVHHCGRWRQCSYGERHKPSGRAALVDNGRRAQLCAVSPRHGNRVGRKELAVAHHLIVVDVHAHASRRLRQSAPRGAGMHQYPGGWMSPQRSRSPRRSARLSLSCIGRPAHPCGRGRSAGSSSPVRPGQQDGRRRAPQRHVGRPVEGGRDLGRGWVAHRVDAQAELGTQALGFRLPDHLLRDIVA